MENDLKNSRLSEHYREVSNRYDKLYEKLFGSNREKVAKHLSKIIMKSLVLTSDSSKTIADIGGGTGKTIDLLKRFIGTQHKFILVEPNKSMSDQAMLLKNKPDLLIPSSAQHFVRQPSITNTIDVIIAQEMIHHVSNPQAFFEGAYNALKKHGCMIIVTRPLEIEFPFSTYAKKAWKESYSITPDEIPQALKKIGFHVREEVHSFPIKIDKASWIEMVISESLFSISTSFTPQQKQQELAEMEALDELLHFNDNQIFIIAEKK